MIITTKDETFKPLLESLQDKVSSAAQLKEELEKQGLKDFTIQESNDQLVVQRYLKG